MNTTEFTPVQAAARRETNGNVSAMIRRLVGEALAARAAVTDSPRRPLDLPVPRDTDLARSMIVLHCAGYKRQHCRVQDLAGNTDRVYCVIEGIDVADPNCHWVIGFAEGVGDYGAYTQIYYDTDGRFLTHGCWSGPSMF